MLQANCIADDRGARTPCPYRQTTASNPTKHDVSLDAYNGLVYPPRSRVTSTLFLLMDFSHKARYIGLS